MEEQHKNTNIMNLRYWSKQHTWGCLSGVLSPLLFTLLIVLFYKFIHSPVYWNLYTEKAKIISLACISNLAWFHLAIRKKNFDYAMGIILATILYLFVIIYYKFVA
jgi:hypothetical protein